MADVVRYIASIVRGRSEKMIIIGLTGGIASGKSTVSAELKKIGVPIFDADQNAREAVAKGSEGLELVIKAFGKEYLLSLIHI